MVHLLHQIPRADDTIIGGGGGRQGGPHPGMGRAHINGLGWCNTTTTGSGGGSSSTSTAFGFSGGGGGGGEGRGAVFAEVKTEKML